MATSTFYTIVAGGATVETATAGGLSGDGTSGNKLSVSVDGTTVNVNGSDQLAVDPDLIATIPPIGATYLTTDDETGTLPGSVQVLAGDNITLDDSTPGELTIAASGGGTPSGWTWDATKLLAPDTGTMRIAFTPPANLAIDSQDSSGSLPNGEYYIVVVGVDAGGGLTAKTNEVHATVAGDSDRDIALTWDHASYGDRIYYGPTSGGQDHYVLADPYINPGYLYDTTFAVAGVPPSSNTAFAVDLAAGQITPTFHAQTALIGYGWTSDIFDGLQNIVSLHTGVASLSATGYGGWALYSAGASSVYQNLVFAKAGGTPDSPLVTPGGSNMGTLSWVLFNDTGFANNQTFAEVEPQLAGDAAKDDMRGVVNFKLAKPAGGNEIPLQLRNDSAATAKTYVQLGAGGMVSTGPVTASDFIVSGSRFKSDTTTGHTAGFAAYDVNDTTYRDVLVCTNGDAVACTLATPTGGTLAVAPSLLTLTATVIGSLGTCDAGASGQVKYVTDALLPAALAIVAAGGAVKVPVFCNGTNWIVF